LVGEHQAEDDSSSSLAKRTSDKELRRTESKFVLSKLTAKMNESFEDMKQHVKQLQSERADGAGDLVRPEVALGLCCVLFSAVCRCCFVLNVAMRHLCLCSGPSRSTC
jgi:hypothetical protein